MALVLFPEPDGPEAHFALQQVVSRMGDAPLAALILKVKVNCDAAGEPVEEVTNWMFVEPFYVKALATQLPQGAGQEITKKER